MKPLQELGADKLRQVKVLFTDIDDTITTEGRLPAQSYAALERLHKAGLIVIPVTGRPAGWCDHIARMWPVDGVVGENGAFYFVYDTVAKRMRQELWTAPDEMASNRTRLDALARNILESVPGAALASDQAYRLADLAIDFCEDVPPLAESEIERIVEMFMEAGAVAKVSSIHVNGWFGDYDKLAMARHMLEKEFGIAPQHHAKCAVYVGDSPNDESMFAAFELSVGVANVLDMAHRIRSLPAYLTAQPSGEGFAELADHILKVRGDGV